MFCSAFFDFLSKLLCDPSEPSIRRLIGPPILAESRVQEFRAHDGIVSHPFHVLDASKPLRSAIVPSPPLPSPSLPSPPPPLPFTSPPLPSPPPPRPLHTSRFVAIGHAREWTPLAPEWQRANAANRIQACACDCRSSSCWPMHRRRHATSNKGMSGRVHVPL